MRLPFIGGAYKGISQFSNPQECVNLFLEQDSEGGRNALVGFQGLESKIDIYNSVDIAGKSYSKEIRGMHVLGEYLYVVCGNFFVRVDRNLQVDLACSFVMSTETGLVTIANNGTQIVICDGSTAVAYLYDTKDTSWRQLDTTTYNFLAGNTVTSQDGYIISDEPESDEFFISPLSDATREWDPTEKYVSSVKPGKIRRVVSSNRELWVMKEYSIEVYINRGLTTYNFERISGGFVNVGCGATHSVVDADNTLYWLADDKTVRRVVAGNQPQIISTRQMSNEIEQYPEVEDAVAFSYIDGGKTFYQITFPSADTTWVYEISTGLWTKRASFKDAGHGDGRHRANCYSRFNDRHYCGDYSNGLLYEMKDDVYTDNGIRIIRTRVCPTISNEKKFFYIHELLLDMEVGVGNAVAPAVDPQIMLQISRDNGNTWGHERWLSLGKVGEYLQRVSFRRLGRARDWTFKVEISDPVKVVFTGAYIDFTPGGR